MTEKEETKKISLDHEFWAISERSEVGIPAVELDITTGKYVILLFTSKDSAKKYCWIRNPAASEHLYPLTRRTVTLSSGKREVQQVGLIKIARRILLSKMDHITHFVIDHPGTKGAAMYLSVEDVAMIGRTPVSKGVSSSELRDAIESLED